MNRDNIRAKNIRIISVLLSVVMIASSAAGCSKEKDKKKHRSGGSDITIEDFFFNTSLGLAKIDFNFDNTKKPEIYQISFTGWGDKTALDNVRVRDYYDTDYYTNGTVGLVGAPYYIGIPEGVNLPMVTFRYNEEELRWVDEDDLTLFRYDEYDGSFDGYNFTIDTDNDTVTFFPYGEGEYFLVDLEEWENAWNSSDPGGNDRDGYESDWERECYTGDILKIADKDWVYENAPYFSVSTPEQLAGIVYYVNTLDGNTSAVTDIRIDLMNDIDLKGLEWVPMGWGGAGSNMVTGEINGNGHSIKNMTIVDSSASGDSGFIGFGMYLDIHDISFIDAKIAGGTDTGIVAGSITGGAVFENVYVSGSIEGAYNEYGAFVGWDAWIDYLNCSCDVTVNGEPYPYFSYQDMLRQTTEVVEYLELSMDDYVITRSFKNGETADLRNLMWFVQCDGITEMAGGPAGDRLDLFSAVGRKEGHYTVYCLSWINGTYIRVSDIIEFDYEYQER